MGMCFAVWGIKETLTGVLLSIFTDLVQMIKRDFFQFTKIKVMGVVVKLKFEISMWNVSCWQDLFSAANISFNFANTGFHFSPEYRSFSFGLSIDETS